MSSPTSGIAIKYSGTLDFIFRTDAMRDVVIRFIYGDYVLSFISTDGNTEVIIHRLT